MSEQRFDHPQTEQIAPLPDMKKVYISLHRNYCRQMADRFQEGKTFNVMTMPRGTMLDGRDIGGARINPRYMGESKFNPNEMTATYYLPPDQGMEIKLNMPDGTFERVSVEKLKEAIDEQKQAYREQQKQQEQDREAGKESRDHSVSRSADEEIA